MIEVSLFPAYLSIIIIAGFCILIYLMVKSSEEFTVEQTEKKSVDFAGEIRDSEGPVTTWLWVVYIAITIWALVYLYLRWPDFLW